MKNAHTVHRNIWAENIWGHLNIWTYLATKIYLPYGFWKVASRTTEDASWKTVHKMEAFVVVVK